MKVIKSSVSILDQGPGIEGMFKHIEKCGRISYKSEDLINSESYKRFIKMLEGKGHWAVFELGTVYLKFPIDKFPESLKSNPLHTRWNQVGEDIYLTTNYRIICQDGLQDFMSSYWVEPTENHKKRVTAHWICNRSTSHQLVRHRIFSQVMESQRYCNYNKGKFDGELTYILPQWVYRVRQGIGTTVDSQTYESRAWILDFDGQRLWDELTLWDRTVASRDHLWEAIEEEYRFETLTDESEKLKPEEARGILPNDIKTELCMCGYLEDWLYSPKEGSNEKAGFLNLRCAPDAQSDIRVLAESLRTQFEERGWK